MYTDVKGFETWLRYDKKVCVGVCLCLQQCLGPYVHLCLCGIPMLTYFHFFDVPMNLSINELDGWMDGWMKMYMKEWMAKGMNR